MPLLLDATGLQIQRQVEIVEELAAAIKDPSVLGPSARPEDPSTNIGQLVQILAEREARIQQLLVSLVSGLDINSAGGFFLDTLGLLNGVKRGGALQSSTNLGEFAVDGSFVAPLATNFQVRNNRTNDIWQVTLTGTAVGGALSASLVALESGELSFLSTDTWTLLSSQAGVNGFSTTGDSNPEDLGRTQESDASYRNRIKQSQLASGNDLEAIIAGVSLVPGVTYVGGFDNRSDAPVDGIPPRAFEIVAEGGDDAAIRQAIYDRIPPGAEAFGLVNGTVPLPDGQPLNIGFSRPLDQDIWLNVTLTLGAEYPPTANLVQVVTDAIQAAADSDANPGVDVIPQSFQQVVWAATDRADSRPTLLNVQIEGSTDGTTFTQGRIELSHKQRADFDPSRISVTVVS